VRALETYRRHHAIRLTEIEEVLADTGDDTLFPEHPGEPEAVRHDTMQREPNGCCYTQHDGHDMMAELCGGA